VFRVPVSRNDRQCADVAWLDVRKVAPVHGRHGSDRQALTDRYHRCIRAAQPPVRIAPHQFSHAAQVGITQLGELETITRANANAVEELGLRPRAEILVDQVTDLGQDRRRDDQRLIAASKPVPAPGMVSVAAVSQRHKHVRVNDDHELSTLPAEALRQQLIDPFR
jgi:hypothetical protein